MHCFTVLFVHLHVVQSATKKITSLFACHAFSCASISSSWLMSLRNQIKVRAGNRPVYAVMFRGVKSSLSGTERGPPLNGTSFESGMYGFMQLQLFSQEAISNMHFNFLARGTICFATCCPGRSVLGDMHKCQGLIQK